MATKFDFIDELKATKEDWKINVRLTTLWESESQYNPGESYSIEMVLVDENGGKIQASIKKHLMNKYKNKLKEGRVYIITNFLVGQNFGKYLSTHHTYRINFLSNTSVTECHDVMIPPYPFDFIAYDEIISKRVGETYLVDVMGELTGIGNIEEIEKEGRITKKLTFQLEDEHKKKLSCTVWGNFAERVAKDVGHDVASPFVIIFHLARFKDWRGVGTLSNSFGNSRILCDQNLSEIVDFKGRLVGRNEISSKISQLSSQPSLSIKKDFIENSERKFLDDIRETRQVSKYVTLAKVVKIETQYDWFYISCTKCRKKAIPHGDKLWCGECIPHPDAVTRYKVQLRVIDRTGSASFVLFDRDVENILQVSASNLREKLIQAGEADSFPKELDKFLDKEFIFKIEISKFNIERNWPVYTVIRLTDDKKLIEEYLATSDSIENVDLDDSIKQGEEVHDAENDTVSITCSSSTITPSKRTSSDKDRVEELSIDTTPGQYSCNKMKKIKIEKEDDRS